MGASDERADLSHQPLRRSLARDTHVDGGDGPRRDRRRAAHAAVRPGPRRYRRWNRRDAGRQDIPGAASCLHDAADYELAICADSELGRGICQIDTVTDGRVDHLTVISIRSDSVLSRM